MMVRNSLSSQNHCLKADWRKNRLKTNAGYQWRCCWLIGCCWWTPRHRIRAPKQNSNSQSMLWSAHQEKQADHIVWWSTPLTRSSAGMRMSQSTHVKGSSQTPCPRWTASHRSGSPLRTSEHSPSFFCRHHGKSGLGLDRVGHSPGCVWSARPAAHKPDRPGPVRLKRWHACPDRRERQRPESSSRFIKARFSFPNWLVEPCWFHSPCWNVLDLSICFRLSFNKSKIYPPTCDSFIFKFLNYKTRSEEVFHVPSNVFRVLGN